MPAPQPDIAALDARARENLSFIRETMARATAVTVVPGWGMVLMGLTALVAAWLAGMSPGAGVWLEVWLAAAAVAGLIGSVAMWRKGRREAGRFARPARRFLLSCAPPLVAGALLTPVLVRHALHDELPGVWLLLYGTGIVTGGAFSVRVVPLLGLAFVALGTVALLLPAAGGLLMAVGFGGLHLGFGAVIARRHGG